MDNEEIAEPKLQRRDPWEVKEDLRAVKRALKIFKDKERLEEVQELIKENKVSEKALDAVADGNLKDALGL